MIQVESVDGSGVASSSLTVLRVKMPACNDAGYDVEIMFSYRAIQHSRSRRCHCMKYIQVTGYQSEVDLSVTTRYCISKPRVQRLNIKYARSNLIPTFVRIRDTQPSRVSFQIRSCSTSASTVFRPLPAA